MRIRKLALVTFQRRLEEIHEIVRKLYGKGQELPCDLKSEVRQILQDGNVTEGEYARLLALLRKWEGSQAAPVSS